MSRLRDRSVYDKKEGAGSSETGPIFRSAASRFFVLVSPVPLIPLKRELAGLGEIGNATVWQTAFKVLEVWFL